MDIGAVSMKKKPKKWVWRILIGLAAIICYALIYTGLTQITSPDKYVSQLVIEKSVGYREVGTGIYYGDLLGTTYDGQGRFDFVTGESYEGTFVQGAISGEGTLILDGVGAYEGSFADGVRSGNGVFTWENGVVYNGSWNADKLSGQGTVTYPSGVVLNGEFSEGKIISGTLTHTIDTASYVYAVKDNQPANTVSIVQSDGTKYEGSFSAGIVTGSGLVTYPNGDTYNGDLVEGMKQGKGTYTWMESGDTYIGSWEADTMSGSGVYSFGGDMKPKKLTGTFLNGLPEGECTYQETATQSFTTTWAKGKCTKVTK